MRQAVGDWFEFIDDVEAHFGDGDPSPSTTTLDVSHVSDVVHASGDMSPETPTTGFHESPKEALAIAADPMEPTLVQLAERIKLQFAQLKLALASEYEERKTKTDLQMADPIADSSEEVLTQVSGVSLFLEV